MKIIENLISFIAVIGFCVLFFYGIAWIEEGEQATREAQRKQCVESGGEYAEYQANNAVPSKDYCIK
jgi:hypothetical protein